MSIQQMRQQIIEHVSAVTDENILRMLDEELSFYLEHKEGIINMLSEKDMEELTLLASQPIENNTISFDAFKDIMNKWRMK
jgi:hypothetical protein